MKEQSSGTGKKPKRRSLTRRQYLKSEQKVRDKKALIRQSNTKGAVRNRSINEQRRYERRAKPRRSK